MDLFLQAQANRLEMAGHQESSQVVWGPLWYIPSAPLVLTVPLQLCLACTSTSVKPGSKSSLALDWVQAFPRWNLSGLRVFADTIQNRDIWSRRSLQLGVLPWASSSIHRVYQTPSLVDLRSLGYMLQKDSERLHPSRWCPCPQRSQYGSQGPGPSHLFQ